MWEKTYPCKIILNLYYLFFFLSRSPNTKPAINKWFPISKHWIVIVIWLCFRSDFLIKRKINLSKIEFSCSLLRGQFNFEHLESVAYFVNKATLFNSGNWISRIWPWLPRLLCDYYIEKNIFYCEFWSFVCLGILWAKRKTIEKNQNI